MAPDKALERAVRHWPYAMGALDDGRLPLDNNLAERGIKPFVIGRKNFLYSSTMKPAFAMQVFDTSLGSADLPSSPPFSLA